MKERTDLRDSSGNSLGESPGEAGGGAGRDIRAYALQAMLLERCRRPLGHEMKNAVQSLYSGIEILAKSVAAGEAARVSSADCVALLRQQLDSLQHALGRILDDVAPEQAQPAPLDICALLNELTRFLATDAAVAGVKLQLHTPEPMPIMARADVVRRVLLGYLLIAIDRLRGGGTLAIGATTEPGRVLVELRAQRNAMQTGRSPDTSVARHNALDADYVHEVARELLAAEQGECWLEETDGSAVIRMILPGA